MGEPCLVRSLSQPSNSSPDSKDLDPLRALRSSVSFGRYVSDTSSWEKWSCFSNNNKYLEEAEKISKPGSVAEKKALLEAHFNKIRAKKTNIETDNNEPSIVNNSSLIIAETHEKRGPNVLDPHIEIKDLDMDKKEEFEMETKPVDSVEKVIQCEVAKLPDIEREYNVSRKQEKMPIFDNAKQGNLVSTSKKKQTLGPTKFITDILASKFRSSIKLSPSKKEDSATQSSKKTDRASLEKRASTLKSIHMSVDNSSRVGESIKKSTTMVEKTGDPKGVKFYSKISRDTSFSMPRQSSTWASVAENETVAATNQIHKSIKTLDKPPVLRRTAEPLSPPIDSKMHGPKTQSPKVASSPFSLQCEGRVAKRKEFFQKLEEKQKAKEVEKVHLQAKSKVQLTGPQTPKHAKHLTSSMVVDYGSRPLWRSNKIEDDAKTKEKSTRSLVRSSSTMLRKNKMENASPNIQRWL